MDAMLQLRLLRQLLLQSIDPRLSGGDVRSDSWIGRSSSGPGSRHSDTSNCLGPGLLLLLSNQLQLLLQILDSSLCGSNTRRYDRIIVAAFGIGS